MKTKKKNELVQYLKANRKGSREAELEQHSRPVSYNRVYRSKKVYDRKKYKADDKDLPYLFLLLGILN
ncbi:hypothetical protein [Parabacteroides sp. PF5-9]|uniref:hypothetical protein n=1 Tax=Parabacteroides sp. PF5-9 TaxID=1742404 RepID=UPI0024748DA8|nr:hypothetical protein [Parabacteroides sp. PF5-9]MDH6358043.1 hypothetical protein [Parabacteroides sp. PF5-9]